jgi:hypothetical protein
MFYYGRFNDNNSYNRQDAVRYALTYAIKPNPAFRYFASHGDDGGDCSNFVSQCLRAGGAPFAYGALPWWYKKHIVNRSNDVWSVSWAVAHSLYWTLKRRDKSKAIGLKAKEVKDMSELELGDLIQYEDYKGSIYHSAIITSFTHEKGERVPLISQHSFDAANTTYIKPKAKKMHFMKVEIS